MNKNFRLEEKITNLFITNNTLLQQDLKIIEARIEAANELQELFDIFAYIKSLRLKFKNEKSLKIYTYGFSAIAIFLMLIGIVVDSQMPLSYSSFNAFKYYFFSVLAFILVGIIYSWSVCKQFLSTKQLSDLIMLKKVALDNNLEFEGSDKKRLLQHFENMLLIFYRGVCNKELTSYIKGQYANKFTYHYFNLHYVVANYSTSTDTNGNTTSTTTHEDHYVYGIITSFSSKHFIKISSCDRDLVFMKAYRLETGINFIRWNTASIAFNKKFEVYTDNEQAAALFLQPKVIERIEELYDTFPDLDIEVAPQGLLVLSTPDQQLLNYNRQYGVDQLEQFKHEIKKVLDQTKLNKALEFIGFLQGYHQHI